VDHQGRFGHVRVELHDVASYNTTSMPSLQW